MAETGPNTPQDLSDMVEAMMRGLQNKFQAMSDQIVSRMEEMGTRIDDLEKNVADLMTQAGMDESEAHFKQDK
uniref:Heat shock factor-binding protein 1 n=1 Tax=Lepisosteus oculatus TaxID=7918 RepID=W5MPD7_LEPOC